MMVWTQENPGADAMNLYFARVYESGNTIAVWPCQDPYIAEYAVHAETPEEAVEQVETLASSIYDIEVVISLSEEI